MDFGVFCTGELAETTRTTLDNCLVDLATGFVGLISGLAVVDVDGGGFVSITEVDDNGLSLVVIAFGCSVQTFFEFEIIKTKMQTQKGKTSRKC